MSKKTEKQNNRKKRIAKLKATASTTTLAKKILRGK